MMACQKEEISPSIKKVSGECHLCEHLERITVCKVRTRNYLLKILDRDPQRIHLN
jgi:hypothetical protein